jgi:hypothetical protein
MTDINIRLLLHNLWRIWRKSGFEKDRPRSFVFLVGSNPVQEVILGQWGVQVLGSEIAEPEKALIAFLEALKAKVAALHRCRET